jgi:RHS repeat-associated protein
VRAASGEKLDVTTPYLQRLEYDEFAQRAFLLVGNGAETAYSYDPFDRRLARLTAGDFQDLHYDYDLVGNITQLSNRVPVPPPNELGGPVDQTFAYDGLYRLTHATGEWRFGPNKQNHYSLSLAYNTIHNITRKTQSHGITTPGGTTVPQKLTTYDFPYAYAGRGPHAPTVIGERAYAYDGNGNQTGWDDLTSGQRRTIVWDEENRVREIRDNGRITAFVYDDAGERVIKRGAQGETAYVNQFWTVRNRSVGTKHIFAGETRIASKVIPGDAHVDPGSKDPFTSVLGQWWQHRAEQGWQSGSSTVQNPHYAANRMPDLLPEDNFVYFYHPDHLGSTSFATAATGELYEHLQYFPFGETWVSEQTNTQRLPNLFTGKELDEETQLYYFGARYYDPRTSVWQSADPILGSYMAGEPNGGVYAPVNLGLYTYAWNNPLIVYDPDGRQADVSRFVHNNFVIPRELWGARDPLTNESGRSYEVYKGDLREILNSIVVHHSGPQGRDTMKAVQDLHMGKKEYADIGYHFGIDREGNVYEGRPIGVKGTHVNKANTGKIGIVLLGNYDDEVSNDPLTWLNPFTHGNITPAQEASLLHLTLKLREKYPQIRFLGGHGEFAAGKGDERSCPGAITMEKMPGWRKQLEMLPPPVE